MRSPIVPAISLLLSVGAVAVHAAAPGLLDPTFGTGGVARVLIPDPTPSKTEHYLFRGAAAFGVAIQSDGKVVAAGEIGPSGDKGRLVLTRHDTAGVLDPTFGTNGVAVTTVNVVLGTPGGMLIQPDGKIVVAFTWDSVPSPGLASPRLAVARFDAAGALDTAFGASGIASAGGTPTYGASVARDAGGNLVVAGQTGTAGSDFLVARFDASGVLDASFGTGGLVTTDFGFGERALAVVVQPDGAIVAAGAGAGNFGLARYDAAGNLDATFGTGGRVTTNVGGGEVRALVRQPDGLLVAAGYGPNFPIARYDTSGALDAGFGSGGVFTTSIAGTASGLNGLVVEPDGGLVAVGRAGSARVVLRLQTNGTLDPSFGDGGIVRTYVDIPSGAITDTGSSIARQGDGTLVVADDLGEIRRSTWAVTRYLGGRCGNGIVETGEDCDDGNLVDGDGCASSCCTADADGDGRCDAVDPCTAPGGTVKPKLTIAWKNHATSTFTLKADAILPHPFSPALDPTANGIRVLVSDTVGTLLDVSLPPGLFNPATRTGWKVGSAKWTYVDSTDERPFGIQRAVVQDRSAVSPGTVRFTLVSKGEYYSTFQDLSALGTQLPFRAEIVPNGIVSPNGQCVDVVFPGVPACVYTVAFNAKLVCK